MGIALTPKSASLLAMCFQQAALVLATRYSKTRNNNLPMYLTSVAIWSAELLKLCMAFVLEHITTKSRLAEKAEMEETEDMKETTSLTTTTMTTANPEKAGLSERVKTEEMTALPTTTMTTTSLKQEGRTKNYPSTTAYSSSLFYPAIAKDLCGPESFKLIIPALCYLAQNNLFFFALSNLSVPTYQVTNQGKLLTTAILSRLILKKPISCVQYLSLVLLGLGVAVVTLSEVRTIDPSASSSLVSDSSSMLSQKNYILGILAVICVCFTSAFAGVYFELVLTSKANISVHKRNFQLAFWSILIASGRILHSDMSKVKDGGLFQGFSPVVLLVIIFQALTGLVVSLTIKYAGNILKGFATSAAVAVAVIASIFMFGSKVGGSFFVGATMVGTAVKMYSLNPQSKEAFFLDVLKKRKMTTLLTFSIVVMIIIGHLSYTMKNQTSITHEVSLSNTTHHEILSAKNSTI